MTDPEGLARRISRRNVSSAGHSSKTVLAGIALSCQVRVPSIPGWVSSVEGSMKTWWLVDHQRPAR